MSSSRLGGAGARCRVAPRPGAGPVVCGWLLAALVAPGCVTIQEFRALEREVVELQQGRGGAGSSDTRLADLAARVDELEREMGRMRGSIDEAKHAADQARSEARALPRTSTPPVEAVPGEPPPGPESSQEIREYEEAFRAYRQGDYGGSIDRFRAFLQNNASSEYADNALFWMGECYYKLGDLERAVLTFEDVVKRYPQGNKVPDALYRQATALLELGERSGQRASYAPAARQIFERIARDYPSSDRAAEANRQLEKLGR